MSFTRTKAVAALAAFGSLLAVAPPASAAVEEINTRWFREQVTVNGILQHQRAFQRIADANGGTRASATPGYDASVAYVKRRLERAGYRVSEQTFPFPFFQETGPASLTQLTPARAEPFATGTFEFSGSGDVTGRVVPIDVVVPIGADAPPSTSTSGCEVSDFPAPGDAPAVALLQRGLCPFGTKAANAEAAGYDAAVIFNEGQPGRQELLAGTLGTEADFGIPVVALSYADGAELVGTARAGETRVRVVASTEVDRTATTSNVIADTPRGDADRTIVVGAHLDSVLEGPGINDNGSGTAGILEIAEEMAENGVRPRNRVRFAFWGAEESGLVGSTYYVGRLTEDELEQHYANLNFDMIGSPNYVRFVYDGDGSDTPIEGPPGSAQIEDVFTGYFASQGLASAPTEFSGRSDYGPFIAAGIPAGGLFSGAEGIKTAAEASIFGGTAGEAYDACYHAACDDLTNLSTKALFELGDAAAHATLTLARTRTGFFEDGSRRATSRSRRGAVAADFAGSHALR